MEEAYPEDDGDDASSVRLEFSDGEPARPEHVPPRSACERAVGEIEQRLIQCTKCPAHHLVPPGFLKLYAHKSSVKFECARIGAECASKLKPRSRQQGRVRASGSSVQQPSRLPAAGDAAVQKRHAPSKPEVATSTPSARSGGDLVVSAGPSRLGNLGFSCYVNATVQVLRRAFADTFSSRPGSCPLKLVLCKSVLPQMWPLWTHFPLWVQRDASEFMEHLLRGDHPLHATCGGDCLVPVVRKAVGISSVHYRQCLSCGAVVPEPEDDVVLRIPEHSTVQGGLLAAQISEWHVLGETFLCTACGLSGGGGLAKCEVQTAPPILVVRTAKFAQRAGPVAEMDVVFFGQRYQLLAAIHHEGGSPHSGHYTATVVIDGARYLCDDDRQVKRISEASLRVENAFVAIYKAVATESGQQGEGVEDLE